MTKKNLAAWDEKTIREALNIQKHLINAGMSWDDVEEYLKIAAKNRQAVTQGKRKKPRPVLRLCPECGRALNASMIHAGSEKYNEGYRSYWLCGAACCPGRGCGYEEYSILSVQEWKRLSKKS